MKKAVVTGGAGFLGSSLVERLAGEGIEVVIIDDLSTGKRQNIEPLLGGEKVTFTEGSISDLPLLEKLFAGADCVFHLAAVASIPSSIDNPLKSNEVNIAGTLNVLLAARNSGVSRLVFTSSAAVYGDAPLLPVTEETLPRPLSPYAVTKLAGEYYCDAFTEVYGLSTVCLRPFNVYGPGQARGSQYAAAIPVFIGKVLNGEPPVIFGDGEQTRDYTFVRDVAGACLLAAKSDITGPVNICQGEGISMNRLVGLIARLAGKSIEPAHEPARPGEIVHSRGDTRRAKLLGYEPEYDMESGLAETIEWFKNNP